MIIGKQPIAGHLMLHSLCRRALSPKYLSTQPAARKDVTSVAGRPMDLVTEHTHLAAFVVAGSALPTRPYRLSVNDDIDATLTSLGCIRLTDTYRVELNVPTFSNSLSEFSHLTLVKNAHVPNWSYSDRMIATKGFNPKEDDVFMLVLVQETFSTLMEEVTVFVVPYAEASLVTKGSEFIFNPSPTSSDETGLLGFSQAGIKTDYEELRSMAVKGAN